MKVLPILAGAFSLGLFTFGAACSSDTAVAGLEDVVYEGGATDEALAAMTALTPKASPKPLAFTTPAPAAKLPAATVPTFAWGESSGGALDAGTGARTPLDLIPRKQAKPWRLELFGGGTAHAHGEALNGKAYFVAFSTSDNAKLLRVFTSGTTYKPSADAWQKLTTAKGTITAKLQSAVFDNNAIAVDGGPFEGTPVSFTVAP